MQTSHCQEYEVLQLGMSGPISFPGPSTCEDSHLDESRCHGLRPCEQQASAPRGNPCRQTQRSWHILVSRVLWLILHIVRMTINLLRQHGPVLPPREQQHQGITTRCPTMLQDRVASTISRKEEDEQAMQQHLWQEFQRWKRQERSKSASSKGSDSELGFEMVRSVEEKSSQSRMSQSSASTAQGSLGLPPGVFERPLQKWRNIPRPEIITDKEKQVKIYTSKALAMFDEHPDWWTCPSPRPIPRGISAKGKDLSGRELLVGMVQETCNHLCVSRAGTNAFVWNPGLGRTNRSKEPRQRSAARRAATVTSDRQDFEEFKQAMAQRY